MIITNDVYHKVLRYAKKVTKLSTSYPSYEDVAQDTFAKLIAYEGSVAHMTSFIYTTVYRTYIKTIQSANNHVKIDHVYYEMSDKTTEIKTEELIQREIRDLLHHFESEPAKRNIITLMINNPGKTYEELGQLSGINFETIKANLRHIRLKLKAKGIKYENYL